MKRILICTALLVAIFGAISLWCQCSVLPGDLQSYGHTK